MRAVDRLLLGALLLVLAVLILKRADPAQAMPLIHADYQRCVTFDPGPLDKPHRTIGGLAPVSPVV